MCFDYFLCCSSSQYYNGMSYKEEFNRLRDSNPRYWYEREYHGMVKDAFKNAVVYFQRAGSRGGIKLCHRTYYELGELYAQSVGVDHTVKPEYKPRLFSTCDCQTENTANGRIDHRTRCVWYIEFGIDRLETASRVLTGEKGEFAKKLLEAVNKIKAEARQSASFRYKADKEHKEKQAAIEKEEIRKRDIAEAEKRRREQIEKSAYEERMRTDPDFRYKELLLASQLKLISQKEEELSLLRKIVPKTSYNT